MTQLNNLFRSIVLLHKNAIRTFKYFCALENVRASDQPLGQLKQNKTFYFIFRITQLLLPSPHIFQLYNVNVKKESKNGKLYYGI